MISIIVCDTSNRRLQIMLPSSQLQLEVEHFTRYWVTLKPRIA